MKKLKEGEAMMPRGSERARAKDTLATAIGKKGHGYTDGYRMTKVPPGGLRHGEPRWDKEEAKYPAYKNPYADYDDQKRDAFRDVGGREKLALAVKAAMKNNGYNDTGNSNLNVPLDLEDMQFDVSDTPQEPIPSSKRKGPPPVPVKALRADPNRGHSYNPGMPPRKNEAPEAPGLRRRSPSQTVQITPQRAEPPQSQAVSSTGKWDVTLPDGRVLRIPASSAQVAQQTAGEWMKQQPRAQQSTTQGTQNPTTVPNNDPNAEVDFKRFQVAPAPNESTVGGSIGAGPQEPLSKEGLEMFRMMVNQRIQEIVRKKEGGGGYNLYSPNKGKKKNPKPVGEFPTRIAAKRAELARFPPKDPEQLKRARKRLDKLAKDPKKQQDTARKELSAKKPKRSGRAAGERKKAKKEAFIQSLTNALSERLFREDEMPGSPWDERLTGLDPTVDKKLHKYHQNMDQMSSMALGDGHRALSKALKGMAKVNPGDVMRDEDRGKMFMPIMLDVDGDEIGPVHLYVDGGMLKIEVSPEARESIAGLDPVMARDLRGGLMSFQEDHLPKIDRAKRAWDERDSYLDTLHKKLEKHVGGMSPVELHLARQLIRRKR